MKAPVASPGVAVAGEPEDIRDGRGLIEIPSGWALLAWIAAAVVVAAAAIALFRRARRPQPAPPPPSADAVALAALERARAWMARGQAERFGTAVSSAVRNYIEARFDVGASRRTTDEFLRDVTRNPAVDLEPFVGTLEELLRRMDLVKFARAPLDEEQMQGLLDTAREFVAKTRSSPPGEDAP